MSDLIDLVVAMQIIAITRALRPELWRRTKRKYKMLMALRNKEQNTQKKTEAMLKNIERILKSGKWLTKKEGLVIIRLQQIIQAQVITE